MRPRTSNQAVFIDRRRRYLITLFMHQPDGFTRTGRDAQAAADASLPNNPVRVLAFFNGPHLASFVNAFPALDAFFRIDLGIIIRIDNH